MRTILVICRALSEIGLSLATVLFGLCVLLQISTAVATIGFSDSSKLEAEETRKRDLQRPSLWEQAADGIHQENR